MLSALFMMGGLGLLVGVGLAAASKIFYVYVDPKILAVESALPGANCGGCGLPGCSANAEAIVAGRAAPNSCVAAGPEVAEAIAAILGVSIEAKEPDIARPGCTYGVQDADTKYLYDGLSDCRAAALLSGGMKVCTVGCLGLGSCAKACPFNAITMGLDGLPVVDEARCTGCGTCERVCPKHIITLSSVTRRIMREYTTDECTTPCQRACPAGIDICEYIRQITLGDYHRSVQVIKERNPFPTVIGRICPRPCEQECRRGLVDEPVAINFLKRFVADYERETGKRVQPYKAPATGRKIAVVGGGVEGLSAAFFAARLGHETTVFEATATLGGLLRTAIARNRLPQDVLDWDIQGVLEMGVAVETGKTLGKDFSVASLLQDGYEAVFLAAGGWDSRLTRQTGAAVERPAPGTHLLIDFLEADPALQAQLAKKGDVVIVGGGPAGLEAARLCQKAGAGKVSLLIRETLENSPLGDADQETLEGVEVLFATGVTRLMGKGDQLQALELLSLDSRKKSRIAAKTLLLAAGRFPQFIFAAPRAEDGQEAAAGSWEAIEAHKPPVSGSTEGLLAAGDPPSDFSAAIKAIGAGRRGAAAIHQLMYGIEPGLPENVITPDAYIQNVDTVQNVATASRKVMPLAPEGPELEKGFDKAQAMAEAGRCLQCGLICYHGCGEQTARTEKPVSQWAVAAH
jgi:NADPH-dependent glutamate synthase beta subunit-like oxidoreductase/Na+-translocating ferredoxin:NAD+ oxidoreductase RNF subunit RnfB